MVEQNPAPASTLKAKIEAIQQAAKQNQSEPTTDSSTTQSESPVTTASTSETATAETKDDTQTPEALLRESIRKEVEADMRKQFSQLGRREQTIKEQLKEIEALKQAKEMLASGKKLDALTALGISYDEITSEMINSTILTGKDSTPQLPAEIQELINWKKQQEAAQYTQVEVQAKNFIKSKAEAADSEFVLAFKDGLDIVYNRANERYTAEGVVDIDEVVAEVEQELHDKYFASFLETKKAKSLLDKRYQGYVESKAKEKKGLGTLSSSVNASALIADNEEQIPQKLRGTKEGLKAGLLKQLQKK